MFKNQLSLLSLTGLLTATLITCQTKKDEASPAGPATVSATEATTIVANSPANYKADSAKYKEAQSVSGTTLNSLSSYGGSTYNVSVPNLRTESSSYEDVEAFAKQLYNLGQFQSASYSNARIPKTLAAAEGVWVYSFYRSTFVKVSSGGGKIVLKFPAKYVFSGSKDTIANAEYTISNLETTVVTYGNKCYSQGGQTYKDTVPSKMSVSLKIDALEILSFSYTTSYDAAGYNTGIDATYTYGTYSFYFKSVNNSNRISSEWGRKNKDIVFRGTGAIIDYKDGKAQECNNSGSINKLDYYHIYADVKVNITFDVASVQSSVTSSNIDTLGILNRAIVVSLTKNSTGEKLGSVSTIKKAGSTHPVLGLPGYALVVKLADGTEKEAIEFAPFLKNFFRANF